MSTVAGSPSSQVYGVPEHIPALQTSPIVHASPSSQLTFVSGVWTQPATGSQLSAVHGLPSSQRLAESVWVHPPFASQLSTVHGLPSSHRFAIAVCVHPPF